MAVSRFDEVTRAQGWKSVAETVAAGGSGFVSSDDFSTYWIQAGHLIRDQVGDDRLLCVLLRRALPKYEGGALTLYRGENLGRWKAGSVGFAWTRDIEVARMFAVGLNATRTGGVLLRGTFPSASIISGPNGHSNWLGEDQFTVDPFAASAAEEIEAFPPQ